jgi:hypothetical protein
MSVPVVAAEEAETRRSSDLEADGFVYLSPLCSGEDEELECRDMMVVVRLCRELLELYRVQSERFLMPRSNLNKGERSMWRCQLLDLWIPTR